MNTMLKIKNNDSGQLLIESMIGIGIVVVGLLGVVGLLSRSASLNRVVSQQLIANYLASEGIEITKNIIDANIIKKDPWNQGFSNGNFEADYTSLILQFNQDRFLSVDSTNGFYGYQSGAPTLFKRTINIKLVSSEEIKVNSIVRWNTRGGGQFEVNLEDHFFNWRP
ncbi:MAG: hypothetical protein D4Q79_00255 [Spirochaetia bacterium]|nr:MAG: hypothetical protein D4Q79_00255 [Spirochaetia bacterium]